MNYFGLILSVFLFSCHEKTPEKVWNNRVSDRGIPIHQFDPYSNLLNNRLEIEKSLKDKIKKGIPLVVHCFVPLCDNEHQGIVPTSASLGDGFSLTSNLYWATSNGMKRFFKEHPKWRQLEEVDYQSTDTVLERQVFERHFENDAQVILICDAYRGDQMESCLNDYFHALAGFIEDSINYKNDYLDIGSEADLMAFNGHNGLMDVYVDTVYANRPTKKDAVVIACSSKDDFNPYFVATNSYPLINTTSLLYPGAFVLDGVIEKWALLSTDEVIRCAAGDAYNRVKKCGQKAARNLFHTGW